MCFSKILQKAMQNSIASPFVYEWQEFRNDQSSYNGCVWVPSRHYVTTCTQRAPTNKVNKSTV